MCHIRGLPVDEREKFEKIYFYYYALESVILDFICALEMNMGISSSVFDTPKIDANTLAMALQYISKKMNWQNVIPFIF